MAKDGTNRGGPRTGAGRPMGRKSKTHWSPEQVDRFRELIQTRNIIQTLNSIVAGDVQGTPQRVSAALGLLRKVLPDLVSAETKAEHTHTFIIESPAPAVDIGTWQNGHTNILLSGDPSPDPKPN